MEIALLPKFLQVELTYACNSRCSFCYNPSHDGKINRDKLLQILAEINSYAIRHVQFIGGEVSILPDLPEYLSLLDNIPWRSIVTNGRTFRADVRGKINEIYISVHGDSAVHEQLTSEPGSFAVIEENIQKYVDWGIDVNSDTVLTKFNADKIFGVAHRAKQLGMKRLFLNIFQPEGLGSHRPDFSPSLQQIQSAISQMIQARDQLGFEMYFGTSTPLCLDERLITQRLAFRCGAGEWFGSISPQGEFRICNHSTKSYGNISSKPLNTIWHSRNIDDDYRNAVIGDDICRGCPALQVCRGGCRINQDGAYRVDPLVSRDRNHILSHRKMVDLLAEYESSPFPISYH